MSYQSDELIIPSQQELLEACSKQVKQLAKLEANIKSWKEAWFKQRDIIGDIHSYYPTFGFYEPDPFTSKKEANHDRAE